MNAANPVGKLDLWFVAANHESGTPEVAGLGPIRVAITGIEREGQSQTFFRATLDRPVGFGTEGEFREIILYARGQDFIAQKGDGSLVFAPGARPIVIGYLGIAPFPGITDSQRRAGKEGFFSDREEDLLRWC